MKTKIERILINETNIPEGLSISTRFRSFSEIRTGIFNTIQRVKKKHPGAKIYISHENRFFLSAFIKRNPGCQVHDGEAVDMEIRPSGYLPWELIGQSAKNIDEDIELFKDAIAWQSKIKIKSERFKVVGKNRNLYIHPDAKIYPGVVLDVSSGPIIIDKDVVVTPFSFLEGPLYIAPDARIDNARITGGTIIGQACRIGGEVENTIFENFSNKHHEGFVGHSYIGNWVNLGALATTSDLKNNYGIVKVQVRNNKINTETIKFGSIIGDFSKIAIGVMLNAGSVIDIGCNVTNPRVNGYIPAFTWSDGKERYRLDHFINDTKKIMARRNRTLSSEDESLVAHLYEN
ncbi:MAG: GlmU family protein [Leptospira sp.]|nr:GlmU family protein [Leptospira sp.]